MAEDGRRAFGMTDCKVASPETVAQNYFWAISGPPESNGRFPPFDWDNWNIPTPHAGMPTTFNFTWQKIPIDIELKAEMKE